MCAAGIAATCWNLMRHEVESLNEKDVRILTTDLIVLL